MQTYVWKPQLTITNRMQTLPDIKELYEIIPRSSYTVTNMFHKIQSLYSIAIFKTTYILHSRNFNERYKP